MNSQIERRKFGVSLAENQSILAKNAKDVTAGLKASKRLLGNDSEVDAVKRQKSSVWHSDQENICDNRGKGKSKLDKGHIRKLDLQECGQAKNSFSEVPDVAEVLEVPQKEVEVDLTIRLKRAKIDFSQPETYYEEPDGLPDAVTDFDKTQINDVTSEPHYAHEIFQYYKREEVKFQVPKYMHNQVHLSKPMRSILVDWMVEVQESFELNHETLYLAVKIVDHYLALKICTKNRFQLLGATGLFIAAKFDERVPPSIEDFLYICDDAYSRRDIILMEMEVLKKLNFFIGFPLSYRFLRRYARCAKLSMETLTLSRFILESSLMEYEFISELDSKMAAAALLLALKMKNMEWNETLEFYSEYTENEIKSLMVELNQMISAPLLKNTKTIRNKYSHKIFYEVAKIPPLPLSNGSN